MCEHSQKNKIQFIIIYINLKLSVMIREGTTPPNF